jgi:Ser/Thr protein kinase RdoA (MazF antagonist)
MRRFDELTDSEKTERYARLAEKALTAYGLAGNLTYVARGTNVVFRLRAGGASFALRLCAPGRDHVPLRRELLWLAALGRDTSLQIPEPVLSPSGDLFRSVSMEGVPGTRACMVLRWIDGERREANPTPDEAAAMGQLAAALHRHAETFRWPEELALGYAHPAARSLAAAEEIRAAHAAPADQALLCDAAAFVAEATAAQGAGPEAVGAIHGDLRLRRMRMSQEGSVGIFGFDACRIGAYLDDLSLLWNALDGREATPALHQALLDGYQSVRVFPSDGDNALRAYVVLRAMEDAARTLETLKQERTPSRGSLDRVTADLRRLLIDALRAWTLPTAR